MDWLTMLVDEYPTKRTDSALNRLELAFQDEEDRVMQTAVLRYMRENRFFPSIADLNKYVRHAKYDLAEGVNAERTRNRKLRSRRFELINRAYTGEFDKQAFHDLADEFRAHGLLYNAAYMRRKAQEFEEQLLQAAKDRQMEVIPA